MRLVCPNCEAKYEVPEDAIPETGRDVQCANCGHAWYQMRPRSAVAEAVAAAPAAVVAPPAAAEVTEPPKPEIAAPVVEAPEPAPAPAPAPVVEVAAAAEVTAPAAPEPVAAPGAAPPATVMPETEAALAVATETTVPAVFAEDAPDVVPEPAAAAVADPAPVVDPEPAPAAAAAVPYAVDESVLAILREEAEREAQARRAEAKKALEAQPEVGGRAKSSSAAKPAAVAAAAEEDDKSGNRRTRLPDVEEINSTLRPSEAAVAEVESGAAMAAAEAEPRSSFRSGFLLVLTVAIIGSAIYGAADAIAAAVPSLAGPLETYVGFVDSLRLQLDGLMQSATVAINGN